MTKTFVADTEKRAALRDRAKRALNDALVHEDQAARIEAQAAAGLGPGLPADIRKRRDDSRAIADALTKAAGFSEADIADIRSRYFNGDGEQRGVLWSYAMNAYMADEEAKASVGTDAEATTAEAARAWAVALEAVEALAAR